MTKYLCIDCKKKEVSRKNQRCRSCFIESIRGKGNPRVKREGLSMSKSAIHKRLRRKYSEPKLCEVCKKKPPVDLANITEIYDDNIENYMWMCRKCHNEIDALMGDFAKEKIPIDIEKAKRLYDEGKTLKQIAKVFNCSDTTISRRFKKFGIEVDEYRYDEYRYKRKA